MKRVWPSCRITLHLILCHGSKRIVFAVGAPAGLLESPYPRVSGRTTAYSSASCEAILCQVMCVSGCPCNNNSGWPLPLVKTQIVAPEVLMYCVSNPGNSGWMYDSLACFTVRLLTTTHNRPACVLASNPPGSLGRYDRDQMNCHTATCPQQSQLQKLLQTLQAHIAVVRDNSVISQMFSLLEISVQRCPLEFTTGRSLLQARPRTNFWRLSL